MSKTPPMPGEVGKVFLDFKDDDEGFLGVLHERVIYEDLQEIASEEEIKRLINRAEELEIIRRLVAGILQWGPRMHLLQEYKASKGLMPEEHLSKIREYTFDLSRRSERWVREFKLRCLKFRDVRLPLIESGDTFYALPFGPPPLIVLHLVSGSPLKKDYERAHTYLSSLAPLSPAVRPMSPAGSLVEGIRAGDGYQTHAYNPGGASAFSYLQVFHNGVIEAVRASVFREGPPRLHVNFEREIVEALTRFLSLQQAMGVEPPVGVVLTLTGTKGCRIVDGDGAPVGWSGGKMSAGKVQNPVVIIESFDGAADEAALAQAMKNSFDRVWMSAGYPGGSPNYEAVGNLS